ncbi:hypothetical protein GUJ93_ZPchr0013g36639 [Zizania palustris]|uniref:Uncharacterized protein n=1 Tax=Zizania palustris TaxID=103762 RepID=A0A8J5WS02_ZIZPA|nr:hypothetical protein GUJ93_ZPchr0013g36639 [Zizania palustris]
MGRKSALLVGINYPGTKAELKGCHNVRREAGHVRAAGAAGHARTRRRRCRCCTVGQGQEGKGPSQPLWLSRRSRPPKEESSTRRRGRKKVEPTTSEEERGADGIARFGCFLGTGWFRI